MTGPSNNLRRPIQAHEVEPLRALGRAFRDLRRQAGISVDQLARVAITPKSRQIERIEQGARRTTRATLERLVSVLLLANPDLGDRVRLLERLVEVAGPALGEETPWADKSAATRQAKVERVEVRRALYAHVG